MYMKQLGKVNHFTIGEDALVGNRFAFKLLP
jgi:hypothetical protein